VTFGITIGGIGYVLGPHVSWAVFRGLRHTITHASTVDLVAIGAGLAFGALVSAPLALPLSFLPDPLGTFLPVIVASAVCALAVFVALARKRDLIAPWLKSRAGKAGGEAAPRPPVIVDTNVLIDGRIAAVLGSGFLDERLAVPRVVLDELQRIADADDPRRRARGRRGLEVLTELQTRPGARLEVIEDPVAEERETDAKLVRLAKARGARILTNDHNLNRVAQVQGVGVLSLTELANALRPTVLPGEEISLTLVQEGREAGQGVGFLDDGTMVVVDGGRPLVGKSVPVTVTRLLQTAAGRMIFATPKHAA
jgi:uncharacterized protein YacL